MPSAMISPSCHPAARLRLPRGASFLASVLLRSHRNPCISTSPSSPGTRRGLREPAACALEAYQVTTGRSDLPPTDRAPLRLSLQSFHKNPPWISRFSEARPHPRPL